MSPRPAAPAQPTATVSAAGQKGHGRPARCRVPGAPPPATAAPSLQTGGAFSSAAREGGLLTPTLKQRRYVITEQYAAQIAALSDHRACS